MVGSHCKKTKPRSSAGASEVRQTLSHLFGPVPRTSLLLAGAGNRILALVKCLSLSYAPSPIKLPFGVLAHLLQKVMDPTATFPTYSPPYPLTFSPISYKHCVVSSLCGRIHMSTLGVPLPIPSLCFQMEAFEKPSPPPAPAVLSPQCWS